MATVVLDFDSTLIMVESIEEILRPKLTPDLAKQMETITSLGMSGAIGFHESLSRRLALAAPSRAEVSAFGERAVDLLTPGMAELVAGLLDRGIEVRIVSGGMVEAIMPLAKRLGLTPEHVHAVRLEWTADGRFQGIGAGDPFARSKEAGCRELVPGWTRPVIAVGDGATDYQLFAAGIADDFIAFTFNRRRPAVLDKANWEAADTARLAQLLERMI